MQASESRIRDADMAEEMVDFVKNQILSQSSVAMLAQANVKTQHILSLLGG
jgi:flagellin